jgi:endonuclease/exonuclease/phosphatase family metal-dependent hydrolase
VGGAGHRLDARPDPALRIRVVTLNVEYGRRIPEAIAALRTPPLRGADVIALEEMDAPGVAAIAEGLGMNYVYYPAARHPRTGRDFGNAILSPWPIEASHKVLLPGRSRGSHQARAAVAATVRVGGHAVVAYAVHLTSPWGMGGSGRARQANAVLADAANVALPVIIAGDFNSSGIGARLMAHGFLWPTRKVGHSAGPFSFDHVFVRGLRLSDPTSVGVAKNGPPASDHWPVWAVVVGDRLRATSSQSPPEG